MLIELNIITLNIWGIPYVSLNLAERINSIAEELVKGQYDVVALQEVWSESNYRTLKEKTQHVFPHTYYFYSGVFGSGLCIFSKYPIIGTFFHAWSVNGYVHRIQHGDWFGGKGVGLCRILVNNNPINIYVAHLHAEYDSKNDDYKSHRVIQAFDTAQFILNTRSDSVLQILAGDLNTEPNDIAYKILMKVSKLTDTCDKECIATNECPRNSYTSSVVANNDIIGKRIDYILFRAAANYQVKVIEYAQPLPDRVPQKKFSYSDHEAVYAKIIIHAKESGDFHGNTMGYCNLRKELTEDDMETIAALHECVTICDDTLKNLNTHRKIYLISAVFVCLLLFVLIDFLPPYGFKILYLILKFILCGIIIFCLFMGTIWNIMERHGIYSGKLAMEVALKRIETYNYVQSY